ncbi:MAG: periplasmic heavy metal sensor [Proteobacteria bacterium]|nr:periplasmic heavy metal sensor [Pseudomonadota bacterium]
MKSLTKKVLLVALGTVAVVGFTGCKRGIEGKADHIVSKISRELDLNDAQRSELEKIKQEAITDMRATHPARKALATEVISQLQSDTINEGKIRDMMQSEDDKKKALREKYLTKVAAFAKTLNKEQKAELAKHLGKFSRHMNERFEE